MRGIQLNNLSESMLRVDAIFRLPHMCVNYDSAFRDFEKFKSEHASKPLSVVHISLNSVDKINHAYLFWLVENISANPDVNWYVKNYPESAGNLHEASRLLLTLDNVRAVPEGMSPYVEKGTIRINNI